MMQRRARFAAVPVALIAAVTIAIAASSGSATNKVGMGTAAASKCGAGTG